MEKQLQDYVSQLENGQLETTNSKGAFNPISGLTPEENAIVEIKYKSTRFGSMDAVHLLINAKVLLLKISAITGWLNPDGAVLTILVDQFTKKLRESYPTVNVDEFEYAFRTYGTAVKDWGKQINLSLIDEVMSAYLNARKEVSAKEEQKAVVKPDTPSPDSDLSDKAMQEWFEDLSKKIRAGGYSVQFVPLMLYDWLEKKGTIKKSTKEKYDYLDKAVAYLQGSMVEYLDKSDDRDMRKKLSEFNAMKAQGCFQGEWIDKLKNLAKRMILYDHVLGIIQ